MLSWIIWVCVQRLRIRDAKSLAGRNRFGRSASLGSRFIAWLEWQIALFGPGILIEVWRCFQPDPLLRHQNTGLFDRSLSTVLRRPLVLDKRRATRQRPAAPDSPELGHFDDEGGEYAEAGEGEGQGGGEAVCG